ncbi:TadE/TadG family type IV pilus assembly protein [Novosphingobium bradum]|uniref:TadE/TadG family type IV pilus assembly protein n=1 Tax=Novosphingobium bradum TaxID=1737444 RepID=A0ABV7INW2_9SPHN
MTALLRSLLTDRRGSPSVDFAMTLPALVLVTVGVMQLGIAFLANAGLRNAVEAGARYATVYSSAVNTTNPCGSKGYPTSDQIRAMVTSKAFGIDTASLVPAATASAKDATTGECYVDVSATYPVTFKFVVFTTPAFNLSYTRRAYQL